MTDNPDIAMPSDKPGLSRRTVVKGVAWAAPVIAVATVVPTAAASAPPCSPATTNSLTSWGVNNAWPANNNPNCGQHADVVFIFQASQACTATSLEIVVGLPGENDAANRGAIWLWSTPTANYRGRYGYILVPGSPATTQGGISIPAGGITVPKYKSSNVTAGYREAHAGQNAVNDGIHVAIYNQTGTGSPTCQKVSTVTFTWFWRTLQPTVGNWNQMQSTLLIGATAADIALGAPVLVASGPAVNPGSYTSIV